MEAVVVERVGEGEADAAGAAAGDEDGFVGHFLLEEEWIRQARRGDGDGRVR